MASIFDSCALKRPDYAEPCFGVDDSSLTERSRLLPASDRPGKAVGSHRVRSAKHVTYEGRIDQPSALRFTAKGPPQVSAAYKVCDGICIGNRGRNSISDRSNAAVIDRRSDLVESGRSTHRGENIRSDNPHNQQRSNSLDSTRRHKIKLSHAADGLNIKLRT